jgi:hypothetical protein
MLHFRRLPGAAVLCLLADRSWQRYDFFSSLVARKLATPYPSAHRRARICHVHGKALYSIIGEPNNRNRKPVRWCGRSSAS